MFHNLSCLRKTDHEYPWTHVQFSTVEEAVLAVVNLK